ncbi:MAG: type II toxin-antitoxin system RelE/ParE family toxin [Brumimicrobium sp.]|nr:type II toxin-antitoxin system RelE/ParE family toxin [Brumimicrobium sp.]
MELEVFWSEIAKNKLGEIFDYYKFRASLAIAKKIVNGIVNQTIELDKMPEMGQIEEILKDDEREFRYLVYTNYKIVYFINKNAKRIVIANVFDTRQDPKKLKTK